MSNIFRRQKIDVEALQNELLQKEEELNSLKDLLGLFIQDANMIHLYAALSEEETQIEGLKEKQKVIMEICEKMIQKLI